MRVEDRVWGLARVIYARIAICTSPQILASCRAENYPKFPTFQLSPPRLAHHITTPELSGAFCELTLRNPAPMATLVPPPSKRVKREQAELARTQQDVHETIPDGSVRVRFVDQATGETGTLPVLTVPLSQASTKNLEILLNELQDRGDDRIPYRFFHEADAEALGDKDDLYNSLVKPGKVSAESEIVLQYAPQAVFRVKAVSRCSAAISGHGESILATQFSPINSSRMVSGSGDKTVRIWDCDTGTPFSTLKGHSGWVLAVSYSPDGSMIASGDERGIVCIWEAATGKPIGSPLKGHTKFVTSLSWEPYHLQQPNRPRVASSSKDGTARVWDVIGGRMDFALTGHKGSVTCVKWGGTGNVWIILFFK